MLLKVTLHTCCSQRSVVYGESSRNANHTMESCFLGGRGRGNTLLLSFFVVANIEISYMYILAEKLNLVTAKNSKPK